MPEQRIPGAAPGTDPLNLPLVFYEVEHREDLPYAPGFTEVGDGTYMAKKQTEPPTVEFMGFYGKAAEELRALEKKIEGKRVGTDDDSLAFLECYVRLHKEKLDAVPREVDYARCVRIDGVEYGIWERMAEAPELTRAYLVEINKGHSAAILAFGTAMTYAGYVLGGFLKELQEWRAGSRKVGT